MINILVYTANVPPHIRMYCEENDLPLEVEREVWTFKWDKKNLLLDGKGIIGPCENIDVAFKLIKGYFSNTSYVITDIQRGYDT